MLKIRPDQMDVFAANAQNLFEERAESHVREYFPDKCQAIGDTAVRTSVQLALAKAEQYGLQTEKDVLRYINLMYILGFDFDAKWQWGSEILCNNRLSSHSKLSILTDRIVRTAMEDGR